jgi:hypothetical protein
LPNCPVTREDIMTAEKIFGPDVGSLKGKTVRRTTDHVEINQYPIPAELMSQHREVTIAADIMFVNKLPFFVTISRNIKFSTAVLISDQKHATMMKVIRDVRAIYSKRGFQVKTMLMDGQFEGLIGDLSEIGITLNTVARGEHVPEVERHIRTIKERARCVYNTLPFQKIPSRMVVELIYYSVFWLNTFPARDGISDILSPRSIVTGSQIDFNKHCKLEFGAYVQAHEEHDNTMTTRTTGAIALRPTGNAQGGYFLYSLSTGRVLNRNHWTVLPMPQEVIARVHTLSRRAIANAALTFADREGEVILDDDEDDEDDEDYTPPADEDSDNDDDDDDTDFPFENFDDDDDDDDRIAGVEAGYYPAANAEAQNDNENENANEVDANETVGKEDAEINESADEEVDDDKEADEIENVGDTEQDIIEQDIQTEMDQQYGERTSPYNLRARKPRDYGHMHATLEHTVLTQHSMKKGIQEFGEDGTNAVLKELQQLHDRGVLEPTSATELTREQKRAALHYLMFITKKRCGRIKGRGCADGRKQRLHTTKEDASSPTVAIESVMLSCVIDAQEERDTAIVDIPGAFMHAEMDEIVHMRLESKMIELLARIDARLYRKHIVIENGREVLYVTLKKALYGTMRAGLLFWRLLSKQLKTWGFETNPYDSCVVNKNINGHQCTILWHVDDLKISHIDPEVVTEVIDLLESQFGKEAPLTVARGKVHEYLGMTIDYTEKGKVKFSMAEYIKGMLNELPDDLGDGEAPTPASKYLFDVDKNAEKLDSTNADLFHHNTAKLLFLCKRARPDIQTAVAFLCTRVQFPDVDDYKKLARVMKYLKSTTDLPLTLESDGSNIIKWWADASYAVHPDLKSHTGGAMSLGKGVVYGTSRRQKLNTTSSTEAELVGVADVMPQILWTRYFLEAQGYQISDSIIYQDNQSAILLEKNGKASSSRRTRHINIRYFFVTDRVDTNEVKIEYCPTLQMLADFFTKPLQGSLFQTMRDRVMNYNPDDKYNQDYRSVLKDAEREERPDDGWIKVNPKSNQGSKIHARTACAQGEQKPNLSSPHLLSQSTFGVNKANNGDQCTMNTIHGNRCRMGNDMDILIPGNGNATDSLSDNGRYFSSLKN